MNDPKKFWGNGSAELPYTIRLVHADYEGQVWARSIISFPRAETLCLAGIAGGIRRKVWTLHAKLDTKTFAANT